MQDFSRPKGGPEVIEFKIEDDIFQAFPRVGAGIVDEAVDVSAFGDLLLVDPKQATGAQAIALAKANSQYNLKLIQFLDRVLLPDSAARYAERLLSVEDPIDKSQSQEVVRFLIGEYSRPHPTEPPSPFTNGQGGMSVSSTATA